MEPTTIDLLVVGFFWCASSLSFGYALQSKRWGLFLFCIIPVIDSWIS